ncbi:hypothetical protein [Acaryochloris sp. CCMEE 5410]|nr:hypothetical protein [Acaryochloris sp. CCMEE 5410]KAI9134233.1 hypothetical protein ON05_013735 [Acaryochloris sp. CCMEE 5410]
MMTICDNTNQTELLRFWVQELTHLSPHEVDEVVTALSQEKATLNPAA